MVTLYLRVDFWLEEVKNKDKFKVTFFLRTKKRENKDGTKKQYINNIGIVLGQLMKMILLNGLQRKRLSCSICR